MMQSTMQDFPLNVGMIFRHGRALHGDERGRHLRGRRRLPARDLRRGRRNGPSGWRSALRDRSASRPATASARSCGTPRSTWRRTSRSRAGRGAAHAQHPPVPRAARLHREPRRRPRHHRRRRPRAAARAASRPSSRRSSATSSSATATSRRLEDGGARPASSSLRYDDLLAAADPGAFDFPEVDERAAAAMCYTSGTTGNPKGVVYSHRSTFMHTIGIQTGAAHSLHVERPRPARSSRCSTPTRGARPTRRGWPAPTS